MDGCGHREESQSVIHATKAFLQKFATTLLTERLAPGPAAAAVFWGVLIGVVPIWGLQTLTALGLAYLLRLNKPLILAATFINNPLFLPFLVGGSLEAGSFLRTGKWQDWQLSAFTNMQLLKSEALSLGCWAAWSLVWRRARFARRLQRHWSTGPRLRSADSASGFVSSLG